MLLKLFLAFTLIPLIEIAVLVRLGSVFGFGPTLGLVVLTGLAGAWLARREGLNRWRAVQLELANGRLPATELVEAFLILIAGVVLVTPGVFTDLAGILLLVPPIRRTLAERIRRRLATGTRIVTFDAPGIGSDPFGTDENASGGPAEPGTPPDAGRRGRVIEV